ncbi:MAG: RNA polymerase sigma factor [Butyrivibrio sp.]|nr:RNA polymerase sigma factor [Butyrivibrio sp.]
MGKIDSKENLIRIMQTYQNLVFSICLKMTGDYFVSEDITQETFLLAYKHYDEFDGKNEKAWICRIASNKCIDYLKSSARKDQVVDDDSKFDVKGSTEDEPLTLYLNKEVMEKFEESCRSLPEAYKDVAYEHFINGKTAKTIANQQNVSIKTVQTRIYRARQMLQKSMKMEVDA